MNPAERAAVLGHLETGGSIAQAARLANVPYSRAYRIAQQGGVIAHRWQEQAEKREAEARQREEDRQRLKQLLEAYRNGEIVVPDTALAARVYDALNVHHALDGGDDRDKLEALDTLVYLINSESAA